jgi:hypothetical protein
MANTTLAIAAEEFQVTTVESAEDWKLGRKWLLYDWLECLSGNWVHELGVELKAYV